MKKIILLSLLLMGCTMPNDVEKESIIQNGNIIIEKEKTKQIQYQWKIDSLKSIQDDK